MQLTRAGQSQEICIRCSQLRQLHQAAQSRRCLTYMIPPPTHTSTSLYCPLEKALVVVFCSTHTVGTKQSIDILFALAASCLYPIYADGLSIDDVIAFRRLWECPIKARSSSMLGMFKSLASCWWRPNVAPAKLSVAKTLICCRSGLASKHRLCTRRTRTRHA